VTCNYGPIVQYYLLNRKFLLPFQKKSKSYRLQVDGCVDILQWFVKLPWTIAQIIGLVSADTKVTLKRGETR